MAIKIQGVTVIDDSQNLTITGNLTINNAGGAFSVPSGTEAQRPAPATGQIRFNTTSGTFEGYNGSEWGSIGGTTGSADPFTKTVALIGL